jgi:histidinol-phosphate aminotransferase
MPAFRSDLEAIPVYRPGKPIDELARELGLTGIIKLASNEYPEGPFPEVIAALEAAAADLNRYPENSGYRVVNALSSRFGVSPGHIWLGAGSTELLTCMALAAGGPGTSAVFADPSFVMYPIGTAIAGATAIRVSATPGLGHDLDAMLGAVRADTTIVYVCNPNNPTGTHLSGIAVADFVATISPDVLVVVDEAYAELATAPDYSSAVPLAVERDNVVVTRTFSKVYGLAGLRIGYAIGNPETLAQLRRAQVPFSVGSIAQAGALAALDHEDRVAARAAANAAGRDLLEAELTPRTRRVVPSQTNFVLVEPAQPVAALVTSLQERGVIVRPMGEYIRVTVGNIEENRRLLAAWDDAASALESR